MPVNLAIVDDHALFRKILKNFLAEQPDLKISIQARDMVDFFEKLDHAPVDLLIMDLFMPRMSGNDALMRIRNEYPGIKILVLSMVTDLRLISNMLDAGIHGYLSKSDEPEDLLKAIQAVSEGRIYRNKILTEAFYWNQQNNINPYDRPPVDLSEREKKILRLIWEEKSNKEIADELFLGVRSVEKIRQDLKEKIGVRSTVGLLKYAINKGIVGIRTFSAYPSIF